MAGSDLSLVGGCDLPEVFMNTSPPRALAFPDISIEIGQISETKPVRIGSEEHKRLFCKTLLTTFNPYKPAVIDWPPLDKVTLDKLTSLPIWDIAVQTENRASLNVATYG